MRTSRRLSLLALCAGSGLLLVAAGEPFGAGPLAWVALAPAFWAILGERSRRWAAIYGLLCGVVFFGIHLSWIFLFGWMAYVGLTVFMASWWAAAGAASSLVRRLPLAPVLVAGIFTAAELGRDRIPWGGFGWGTPGLSQVGVPGVRSLASVVGASGLTFLVAFVSALVADRFRVGRVDRMSIAVVGLVTLVFVAVDGVRYASPEPGRAVRVAIVQGDVPRPALNDFGAQRKAVLDGHAGLTRRLIGRDDLDLVVWGEDAIGGELPAEAADEARGLAAAIGVPMLVGRSDVDHSAGTFANLIDHIDAGGRVVDSYLKQHPVPFGEYVPVAALRRYVRTLDQVPLDMLRGDRPVVFNVDGLAVATPICFESAFARDVRGFARAGAELFVFSTNDSSFERTPSPVQHLAHTRMRAIEMRQWGVQVALSGYSAVLSPDGRVIRRTDLFEPALVTATVRARPASSLYARLGDLYAFGWAAGAGLAVLLYLAMLARGWRSEKALAPRPATPSPVR